MYHALLTLILSQSQNICHSNISRQFDFSLLIKMEIIGCKNINKIAALNTVGDNVMGYFKIF